MQAAKQETETRAANDGLLPESVTPDQQAIAEPARKRRSLSCELQAMAKIDQIMLDLDDDDQCLVLAWFVGKFAPSGFTCEVRPTTQTGGPDL